MVYFFTDNNAPLHDIQANNDDPLSTAGVSYSNGDQHYQFSLGFIPFDDYSTAFSCDANLDIPDKNNSADVVFIDYENIIVSVDDMATIKFN